MQGTYRCIAWDMPGYGDSQPIPDMTFESLSGALAALLDELDLHRVNLVGHSMGGMVAQMFVAQHPERVDKLVLAQTSARFGRPGSEWQQGFLSARLKPMDEGKTPADFARPLITSMFADPANTTAIAKAVATMSSLSAQAYRQALNALVRFDCQDALCRIPCPTLCLAADRDEIAPPRVLKTMADSIPDASYVCLRDAGHLAYVEAPDAFSAALNEFLGGGQ